LLQQATSINDTTEKSLGNKEVTITIAATHCPAGASCTHVAKEVNGIQQSCFNSSTTNGAGMYVLTCGLCLDTWKEQTTKKRVNRWIDQNIMK